LYEGLAEKVFEQIGKPLGHKKFSVLGSELEGTVFSHPIYDRESIAVTADYVTTEDGTGVVHTAPGHGHEDFQTGRKYGLPALCPVDGAGVFTEESGEFAGKSIKDADEFIPVRLKEKGNLLALFDYSHSYPYSERDKSPVIYRTTEQWFIRVDHDDLRARALQEVSKVQWFPKQGEARITAMVEGRPDWCISRQRTWGVGIPIFFGIPSGEPLLDVDIMEGVAKLVEEKGSGAWFEAQVGDLIPEGYKHPVTGETEFRKETDTLDVWFDSGVTHFAVLDEKYDRAWADLEWPADLYLEGSDQHRGWFNSSLMTATAIEGAAPYRQVLTHGFLVLEKGEKMSKSKGNVLDPIEVAGKHGADILRLWAASVDYSGDIPYGEELLKQIGENYRRIRNTLRFLLSNLFDYHLDSKVTVDIDKWAVAKVDELKAKACEEYDEYDFSAATVLIHNFCIDFSSFYLDVIKDRMYCDAKESESRRSGQAACHYLLMTLLKLIAPILPHTAEETYARVPLKDRKPTLFLELLDDEGAAVSDDFGIESLLQFRERLYAAMELWKSEGNAKDTQDILVKVTSTAETVDMLRGFGEELPTLLKVSWIELSVGEDEQYSFEPSPYLKCERSRLRRPDVEMVGGIPLSKRDRTVLSL
jgi:isoleucyl-tRNA synthetase